MSAALLLHSTDAVASAAVTTTEKVLKADVATATSGQQQRQQQTLDPNAATASSESASAAATTAVAMSAVSASAAASTAVAMSTAAHAEVATTLAAAVSAVEAVPPADAVSTSAPSTVLNDESDAMTKEFVQETLLQRVTTTSDSTRGGIPVVLGVAAAAMSSLGAFAAWRQLRSRRRMTYQTLGDPSRCMLDPELLAC